ncbi:hypothetical protein AAHA92_25023 [Salvia divinorum]|uniref:Ribosomal protein S20 n=1 Tax=Salvia divinorum TaxID=28513 RepID=A0ABD1G9B5_SALDI
MSKHRRRNRKRRSNFKNFVVFTIYSKSQTKSSQQETRGDREEIEQRIKSLKAISHSIIQTGGNCDNKRRLRAGTGRRLRLEIVTAGDGEKQPRRV